MSNEKFYLGISLDFNSSASLIGTESGVLAAISEERLNREKNTMEIPYDAMIAVCKTAEKRLGHPITVDEIVYSHCNELTKVHLKKHSIPEKASQSKHPMNDWIEQHYNDYKVEELFYRSIVACLKKNGIQSTATKITRIDHHTAHENSAYPVYPKHDKFLSMTADGFGDGFSGRIKFHDGKNEKVIAQFRVYDSPAMIYQYVTGGLNFVEHQHEGKVTGLAAHCEAHPDKAIKLYKELCKLLTGYDEVQEPKDGVVWTSDKGRNYYNCGWWIKESNLENVHRDNDDVAEGNAWSLAGLQKTVRKWVKSKLGTGYNKKYILDWLQGKMEIPADMEATPWELAYAAQYLIEKIIGNWIKMIPSEYKGLPLYCAGGLVANVKLNQRIKDSGFFSNVYVAPPMGDEGTALGCAFYKMTSDGYELKGRKGPEIIINGGTEIDYDASLAKVLEEAKTNDKLEVICFEDKKELVSKVADMLANEKLVHWCQQSEEFGPRALMNHSTLYTAVDQGGTHFLNEAMGRSEYMPYCPVCRSENADSLFEDWKVGEESCRFMAMTMNCKPGIKETYRGGVHVDNTARAQFLYKDDPWTRDAYDILDAYEKKTGLKMIINTSYNTHGAPTCNLAGDCWETWKKSNYVGNALVINNYMFIKK